MVISLIISNYRVQKSKRLRYIASKHKLDSCTCMPILCRGAFSRCESYLRTLRSHYMQMNFWTIAMCYRKIYNPTIVVDLHPSFTNA